MTKKIEPVNVFTVHCNASIKSWLSRFHPEFAQNATDVAPPVFPAGKRVELIVVGPSSEGPIPLARAVSNWLCSPPTVIIETEESFEPGLCIKEQDGEG